MNIKDSFKNTILIVIIALWISTIILYLIGAFVSGDINPANWHAIGKSFLVIVWVIVNIIVLIGMDNLKKEIFISK